MNGSRGSASADPAVRAAGPVLAIGANWIGDAVMSMPAVQAWREANPETRLTLLVKPGLAPLWRLHDAPDEVLTIDPGSIGALRTGRRLRAGGFARAYLMPHSFRSLWISAWSNIPDRRGLPGFARRALGVRVVHPRLSPDRLHQQYEFADLMLGAGTGARLPPPRLRVPEGARIEAEKRVAGLPSGRRIAIMPGAARGPSKRWPVERFADLARRLVGDGDVCVLVLGSAVESAACEAVAAAAGARGRSLAGQTGIPEWAAILSGCDLAVANDSGGMHLACAVGIPVVAIFGRTDPARTGPLGARSIVIQPPGSRSRDISRFDREAARRLASISVDDVIAPSRALMAGRP